MAGAAILHSVLMATRQEYHKSALCKDSFGEPTTETHLASCVFANKNPAHPVRELQGIIIKLLQLPIQIAQCPFLPKTNPLLAKNRKMLKLLKVATSCNTLLETEIVTCAGTGKHGVLFWEKPNGYLASRHCPFKWGAMVVA